MKIGILICGHVREQIVEKHGEYDRFFIRFLGEEAYDYETFFAVDQEFPKTVDACDAYILSGSAHGAYEDHAFIAPLEDFIREAYAKTIPLVGICFGHQIMAQALGGTVVKFDGGWGLGVHDYKMDLGDGMKPIRLNAVHQDQVIEKPVDAEVIGTSEFCQNAALVYGDKAISFQPHPEFEEPFMHDLIALRRGLSFPEEVADSAVETLVRPTGNTKISNYIKSFLAQAAAARKAA